MTISLNWLREYIDLPLSPDEISNLLTDIGLEVDSLKTHRSVKGDLLGIVVGEVVTCVRHPEADRLSMTTINIGEPELLNIVCGAPNVAAGQRVAIATVGAKVYDKEGNPFTIKRGKIRGAESNGMICAEDELGLGTNHDGIMILAADTPIGALLRDVVTIEEDTIFEIGLTPNRSDATNHLGVAQDLAAAYRVRHDGNGAVRLPDVGTFRVGSATLPISVTVENNAACPRFTGVCISGLKVGPSPEWLQKRLENIGVRAINNVVDATNFVLHELGQPLHAYDYRAISGQHIIVKNLPTGTKFTTLDEQVRELNDEDLMICNGLGEGMCIGGVFGGLHSGVTDTTTDIFLEAAFFNAKTIRRTATRHGLRTDAARTFEKGTDPNGTRFAIKRAALLIQAVAGGQISSEIIDIYPQPIEPAKIHVLYSHVNRLIGQTFSPEQTCAILTALNIVIEQKDTEGITVRVPTNKADVLREADIIEEIARIAGLNQVPMPKQLRTSLSFSQGFNRQAAQRNIADSLSAQGWCEMMAVSLSQSNYYKDDLLPIANENLVYINNTSNMNLDIMRPHMLPSGLEAILHNLNRQQNDVRLYEFGKTYAKLGEGKYTETPHLTLMLTGRTAPEHWSNKDNSLANIFELKTYVIGVLQKLGISQYQETTATGLPFANALKLHRGPLELVTFGKVSPRVTRKFDIKQTVFYAEFHWANVLQAAENAKTTFAELNKFPTVRRDLALVLEKNTTFADISQVIRKVGKPLLRDVRLFDVYEDETKLGEGKKSYAIAMTLEDNSRTLLDKDVDNTMQRVEEALLKQLGATVRR